MTNGPILAQGGAPAFELTEAGAGGHADALAIQARLRRRTVQGVGPEDYLTVRRVLQTVVANLECVPAPGLRTTGGTAG